MIRPGFLTSSERRELVACVRSQRVDHGIARRANAILLLDDGESCVQIAKFLYLDDDTIRGWYKTYRKGGWDALSTDGWKGGQRVRNQLFFRHIASPSLRSSFVTKILRYRILRKADDHLCVFYFAKTKA